VIYTKFLRVIYAVQGYLKGIKGDLREEVAPYIWGGGFYTHCYMFRNEKLRKIICLQ
jgi:hypothetical protein